MRIYAFKIEEWMNRYCPAAIYDLTPTCIAPLSLKELLSMCNITTASRITDVPLTYGDITGSERLKTAISALYKNQEHKNITVTHGAIGANQLIYNSLIDKGDDVVVFFPIYQQHYSIPKALGANVKPILLREENNWLPNLRDLEKNITGRTKLIVLNNPNNPTGSVIPDEMLYEIAEIAKSRNSWLLCDEVYRGLNLVGKNYSESVADIYSKGISVGSMSKTYSLPGLRTGWVCACPELINEINKHREYNTISVSILDDYFSAIALENRQIIEDRNIKIAKEGLVTLQKWLNGEVYVKTNMPKGGTTALLRYIKDIPSRTLCKSLHNRTGVLLLPGEVMEIENTVRVSFCTDKNTFETGLQTLSKYLRKV